MSAFKKITKRDNRAVLEKAEQKYQELLTRALALATTRAVRSSPTIRDLYASAVVEGRVRTSEIKAAVVTFTASPFRGGLHYIYPWEYLAGCNHRELATEISWMLRSAVAEKARQNLR